MSHLNALKLETNSCPVMAHAAEPDRKSTGSTQRLCTLNLLIHIICVSLTQGKEHLVLNVLLEVSASNKSLKYVLLTIWPTQQLLCVICFDRSTVDIHIMDLLSHWQGHTTTKPFQLACFSKCSSTSHLTLRRPSWSCSKSREQKKITYSSYAHIHY